MARSLTEHLSPVMEGFENPTMSTLFREMLKITPTTKSNSRGSRTAVTRSRDGTCPPSTSAAPSLTTASSSPAAEKIAFLKSILSEQKKTADSLMESAKKMGPVAQKLSAKVTAYDAAFESEQVAPMPNISGTLQGFTLVFFTLAFFSLAIVASIITSQATGNVNSALKTFGVFFMIYCIAVGIIVRFG
jgi:hypothetical protein